MLKINPNPQFEAQVKLTEPGSDTPAQVTMTFKYKSRKEFLEFSSWVEGKKWAEALPEIIADWKGIDAECTPENIALLVENYMPAGLEIWAAYQDALVESRVKN